MGNAGSKFFEVTAGKYLFVFLQNLCNLYYTTASEGEQL